jgi:carboxylesterase type B
MEGCDWSRWGYRLLWFIWLILQLAVSCQCDLWPFQWESVTPSDRIVQTKYGRIKGVLAQSKSKSSASVEAFLGVPYATPPEKDLRYVPPVTPPPWDHVWSADSVRPVCPQELPNIDNETEALTQMPRVRLNFLRTITKLLGNQSEDCLYMNIFVPTNRAGE